MAGKIAVVLAMSALLTSGVHSLKIVHQNHQDVVADQGEEVLLVCTADVEALACVFRSPEGNSFSLLKGSNFEDGRIHQYSEKPQDCGVKISGIKETDNGQWECSVTGKDQTGSYGVGKGFINIVVTIPPKDIHLESNGEKVGERIDMNLDTNKQSMVDCIALGARPAPQFNWYIGQQKIEGNVAVEEETDENGVIKFKSTLEYNADPKHNGQQLKCEVIHRALNFQELEDKTNWAEVDLDLQFMPEPHSKSETFYGMKEGVENEVRIKFKANPPPTEGVWNIGETKVAVGASSVDEKFKSTQFTEADIEGDYQVVLTFTMDPKMAGKPFSLEVKNSHGTTKYDFQLALSDQPAAEGASGPVIGIVVLIVIIVVIAGITILARAKSILCFKAKSGEPLEEEKEAFDDPEKGKLAGEAKPTPDKKPAENTETKTETEDNKEEKKSNGAHTPV